MKHIRILISTLLLSAVVLVYSQKTVTAEAEYLYVVPSTSTLDEAKKTALEKARLQAIAEKFGTVISQTNTTYLENNGESEVDFTSLGSSSVKGEWIETTDGPHFEQGFDESGQLWIKCRIKGKIREITESLIELNAKLLKNGIEDKFQDTDFADGDDMYLSFQTPSNGYLNVFLADESAGVVYRILPYQKSDASTFEIKKDLKYVFFSEKAAPRELKGVTDEYTMTSSTGNDRNDIFIVFSTNQFHCPITERDSDNDISHLSWKKFNEWLAKQKTADRKLKVINIPIAIRK